jgi:hypothetical protein
MDGWRWCVVAWGGGGSMRRSRGSIGLLHQVAHQPDVIAAWKVPVGSFFEVDLPQFRLEGFQSPHLFFDRTDRFGVFGGFFAVGRAESLGVLRGGESDRDAVRSA